MMSRIGFMLLMLILWCGLPGLAFAGCTFSSTSASLGSQSSFTLATTSQGVNTGSGFVCTNNSLLTLLGTNTISATINTGQPASNVPQLAGGGYTVPYVLCKDSSCSTTYNDGSTITWSSTTLLSILGLFSYSDGSLPLYIKTTTGVNVPAGTYTDTITLHWNYSLCFAGILVCDYTTGSGTSTIKVTLVVTNDCYIDNASNILFNQAALPGLFPVVNGNISVRCTLNSTYSLNLTSSVTGTGNWRRMVATVNGTPSYLQYQILRNSTPWTSTNDYSAVGSGTSQSIPVTAQVNPGQANVPAGSYQDTVTVTITY